MGILILYGAVGPGYNARRGHRALAATLDRIIPADTSTIMFFRQIDEGLWFYLRDRSLIPVPGSQPRYNAGADLDDDFKNNRLEWDPNKRADNVKKILVDWLTRPNRPSSYVLLRTKEYDLFARDLAGLATLVHREHGLFRNELVLLHVAPARPGCRQGQPGRPAAPAVAPTPGSVRPSGAHIVICLNPDARRHHPTRPGMQSGTAEGDAVSRSHFEKPPSPILRTAATLGPVAPGPGRTRRL